MNFQEKMNIGRNTNTITTKQRKTQQKVTRLQKANDSIILKYGSFENLKKNRLLFRRTRSQQYRSAHNDYKTLLKQKKFIENNFQPDLLSHRKNSTGSRVVVSKQNNFLGQSYHHLIETNDNNDVDNASVAAVENIQNSAANMTPPLVENTIANQDNAPDTDANIETIDNNDNLNLNGDGSANNSVTDEFLFIDGNRMLELDEALDTMCANCHRTQSIDLVEHYGECYRISFYR